MVSFLNNWHISSLALSNIFFSLFFSSKNFLSYWLINSSKSGSEVPGVSDTGTVMYGEGSVNYSYGIRPVAHFNKKVVITNGKGTINEPFMIKK